jgi:hypothetical protein
MADVEERLSREEVAKEEIGRTRVSPAVSAFLVTFFLASVYLVPLVQQLDEASQFARGVRADWMPQCCSILKSMPGSWEVFRAAKGGTAGRVIVANRHLLREMRRYEDAQEESSWLTRVFLPWTQWVLTHWLHVGNESVYLGRDGWLFYRPDVDYVTGPGFLCERHFANRLKSANEWDPVPQPDPVKAIVDFDAQMKTRGIYLIVMPTPVKPMIHPDKLARGFPNSGAGVQNVSFAVFVDRLRKMGIAVFDCSSLLAEEHRRTGQAQYLIGDTHWRAEAMGRVAEELANVLRESGSLSPVTPVGYRQEPANLSSLGDIRLMLKLPENRDPAGLEAVSIQQVLSPDGELWKADRNADVLVLGDSFSTIFSMPSMGWGESAGFAEQLAFHLQRPVDRIAQNDDGAFATREALRRETADGGDRLVGKQVLVWQFAARELALGDWRVFPVDPAPQGQAPVTPHSSERR